MQKGSNDKRLLLGAIFLILGGFLLVGNLDLIPYEMYQRWKEMFWHWPMILVLVGLTHIISSDNKMPGVFIFLIGAMFMLPHVFYLPFNFREVFWPTIFIIAGIGILIRGSRSKPSRHCRGTTSDDQDVIDDMAFFGGGDKIITSQSFKGGKITCVFGGLNLNLIRARLSPGRNDVDIFCVFGGMKMIVPEEWDIKINVTSVFGGFADKRNIAPTALENKQGELVIKGIAIFGGGEIKNF